MRIIKLTTLLDFGGQEKQYISFTDHPHLLQNEYIFAAVGHGGFAEEVLKKRGFDVKVFGLPVEHKNIRNILILARWMKKQNVDIVHTAGSEANFHGILAARLAGVRVVIGEQIGMPTEHSTLAQIVFRLLFKFATKVVTISENVKLEMIKQKAASESKIAVIYNPVSNIPFIKKIANVKFQWVFVSRLVPRKNTALLIKAFSSLDSTKRGELHIVGDGPERLKLEMLVRELRLTHEVFFHGFQPEPEKFIANCDVFVHPAFDEGFGIVVIEAMLQKKACLCGRGGGIPEYLEHNVNGWLFDPSNLSDLILKMDNILSFRKDEIDRIGQVAYQKAKDKFTVEKYISTIENFYREL